MEKVTHLYLAEQIHRHLVQNVSLDLPLEIFSWANISPDSIHRALIHPHFSRWSLDYVRRQIVLLSGIHLVSNQRPSRKFIGRLGRITHYLCDFFCTVHNDNHLFEPGKHMGYERSLDQAIITDRRYFDELCQFSIPHIPGLAEQFDTLYQASQTSYAHKRTGFERDIRMAVWFAATIALAILSSCLGLSATQVWPQNENTAADV